MTVDYTVTNLSARETVGQASYNVSPPTVGALFQQDQLLLLHRADAEAGRVPRNAGGLLCRPATGRRIRRRRTASTPLRCPTPSIRSGSRSRRTRSVSPRRRRELETIAVLALGATALQNKTGRRRKMAEAHAKHHDYHLVDPSPWPVVGAVSAFIMAIGADHLDAPDVRRGAAHLRRRHPRRCSTPWSAGGATSSRKRPHQGDHTRVVQISSSLRHDPVHRLGGDVLRRLVLGLFRRRAVSRRRAAAHARRSFTGGVWPPKGIETFDPWHLPLLNTLILLTSGTTVTWAHHALLENDREGVKMGPDPDDRARRRSSPACRPTNMATPPSPSAATSTARPSSWRPASTASTSSSARSS